ncbi:MAG: sulfatase-like hydrolase/transferase, partial [Draconibacterium sp.]|nr:sulfatase-like hydrolase/transferase [Draconibacterium sp.]
MNSRFLLAIIMCLVLTFLFTNVVASEKSKQKPNIVLIMTDDQGWGQTGYYNHPILKTPNLDKMAENGLRFDRFYAGAPVCSPTRASVLTGRACVRSGVPSHGHALRKQEKVLPQALKQAGYVTGHFGKWHLNGIRGPGVPVFKDDSHSPGEFGFDTWLTVTNFFDVNPIMSRNGEFEEFKGTSSDIIVAEALNFIEKSVKKDQPFFAVIWDGSPHSPFVAEDEDLKGFEKLDKKSKHHYGELVAFDRSIGTLRKGLRELKIAENTIVWFCSDNGGLPGIEPETVGGLRGNKGNIWEGGIRVPGIIEWEGHIIPDITNYPASTMDIFPTILDILNMKEDHLLEPVDGASIKPLIQNKKQKARKKPIPFMYQKFGALIDNQFKLVATDLGKGTFELYNLEKDKTESKDISGDIPKKFEQLKSEFNRWYESVNKSIEGMDYPEKKVKDENPERHFWID